MECKEDLENELKTKKICRFCLDQEAPLTNIYSRENRLKNTAPLPLQIMACVSLEVFTNDGMPSLICEPCRLLMDHSYRFKNMCKKSDNSLKQYPLTGVWPSKITHPSYPMNLYAKTNPLMKPVASVKRRISDESSVSHATLPPMKQVKRLENKPLSVGTPKILNKNHSSVKILNKNAIKPRPMEPCFSQTIVKTSDDGTVEVNYEIFEETQPHQTVEEIDPIKSATPIETNVFPCEFCERSFPLRQLLEMHVKNHSRERQFSCEICDKRFFSKYDLGKHLLIHTGEKPYQCVVCDKSFSRSTLLHRHERVHADEPHYLCPYCDKSFLSKSDLEKHTSRHEKNRPFPCSSCDKSFAFKQGLERHEVIHSLDQPYPCEYCAMSFSTPSKLARHLTAHAGRRPYPCRLCPKSYLLSHHLTRHLRSHNVESNSFKCYDCGQSFENREQLIYHSAVHATENMTCPLCQEHFESVDGVTSHIKSHTEGDQYACEFCDLIFLTGDKLENHTRQNHKEECEEYDKDEKTRVIKRELSEMEVDEVNEEEEEDMPPPASDKKVVPTKLERLTKAVQPKQVTKKSPLAKKSQPSKPIQQTEEQVRRSARPSKVTNYAELIKCEKLDDEEDYVDDEEEIIDEPFEDDSEDEYILSNDNDLQNDDDDDDDIKPKPKQVSAAKQLPTKETPTKETSQRTTYGSASKANSTAIKKPEAPVSKSQSPAQKAPASHPSKTKVQSTLQMLPKGLTINRKMVEKSTKADEGKSTESPKKYTTFTSKTQPAESTKQTNLKTFVSKKNEPPKKNAPSPSEKSPDAPMKREVKSPQEQCKLVEVPKRQVPLNVTEKKPEHSSPPTMRKVEPVKRTATGLIKKPDASGSKTVEMKVGDRMVKVQKVLMTKAEVDEMSRQGKIEMRGKTMILKDSIKKRAAPSNEK